MLTAKNAWNSAWTVVLLVVAVATYTLPSTNNPYIFYSISCSMTCTTDFEAAALVSIFTHYTEPFTSIFQALLCLQTPKCLINLR